MSIQLIGSIDSYTKTMKLRTQWNLKQKSGDVTGHQKKSLDEWLQSSASDNDKKEGGDDRLRSIHAKIDAGGKITAKERAYLKANDPQAYSELEASEQEQRTYEQNLKRCKTREEVQRLKLAHLGTSLARVKAVEHDSSIPQEKKLKIMMQEKRRCDKLEKSTREFVHRGGYEKLPTDRELVKAEQEEAERKFPERPEAEKPEISAPEPKTTGGTDEKTPDRLPESEAPKKPRRPEKLVLRETDSPELRKVRRAKAKAAYARAEGVPESAPALDIQG